jgi:D-alanine-D-alanine ligase
MSKGGVVVVAGGHSLEREVSLRSGRACFEALQRLGQPSSFLELNGPDSILELAKLKPEVALLTTHGEGGEDGTLQGALDWLGIPYTGSSAKASALCMDKYLTQLVLSKEELPVAKFCCPTSELSYSGAQTLCGSSSLFSKPRFGGSSIDTGKVQGQEHWDTIIKSGREWMIEEAMSGREITVGLIQEKNGWQVLPILELKSQNDFYDFESKYTEGMTEFIVPAPVEDSLRSQIEVMAQKAATSCGIEGYGRVDMMLTGEGPMILEINTLPGMTTLSDLPAMAKCAGLNFEDLVLKLLATVHLKRK